jgi:hypothetical protein
MGNLIRAINKYYQHRWMIYIAVPTMTILSPTMVLSVPLKNQQGIPLNFLERSQIVQESVVPTGVSKTECIRIARGYDFDKQQAVELCRRATPETTECARIARGYDFGKQQAVELCRRATPETIECARIARGYDFDKQQAVKLCKRATPETTECARIARGYDFDKQQAVELCSHAPSETVECATTAMENDRSLSKDEAIRYCRNTNHNEAYDYTENCNR